LKLADRRGVGQRFTNALQKPGGSWVHVEGGATSYVLFAIRFELYRRRFVFEDDARKERVGGQLFKREVRFGPEGCEQVLHTPWGIGTGEETSTNQMSFKSLMMGCAHGIFAGSCGTSSSMPHAIS
jgi:hypothetical protein